LKQHYCVSPWLEAAEDGGTDAAFNLCPAMPINLTSHATGAFLQVGVAAFMR